MNYSENPLINEPRLNGTAMLNPSRGKQLYFWIIIQNDMLKIIFSGLLSRVINVTHPNLQNKDANLSRIDVSDSPFTIQRG